MQAFCTGAGLLAICEIPSVDAEVSVLCRAMKKILNNNKDLYPTGKALTVLCVPYLLDVYMP